MAHCIVNETPETLEFGPKTWGDLLERLDTRLAGTRRVVTAVRFDGVDQPSFRAPTLSGLTLDDVDCVDIEAEDASTLLIASLDAAVSSLPDLVAGVRLTAAAIRDGAPDAHLQLSALVSTLQTLVALTAASATAADLTHGTACGSEPALTDAGLALQAVLMTIVGHQIRRNGPALATTLEEELAPIVAGWADVLAPMRRGGVA